MIVLAVMAAAGIAVIAAATLGITIRYHHEHARDRRETADLQAWEQELGGMPGLDMPDGERWPG